MCCKAGWPPPRPHARIGIEPHAPNVQRRGIQRLSAGRDRRISSSLDVRALSGLGHRVRHPVPAAGGVRHQVHRDGQTQTAASAEAGTIGLHRSGTAERCAASRNSIASRSPIAAGLLIATGLSAVTDRPAASRPTAECAGAEGRAASVATRRTAAASPAVSDATDSGIRAHAAGDRATHLIVPRTRRWIWRSAAKQNFMARSKCEIYCVAARQL